MARIKFSRRAPNIKRAQIGAATAVLLSLASGGSTPVAASGPNIVEQWDKIAEDTVVGTGAPQIEGFVYMSYTQTAVYDALVGIDGTYALFGPQIAAPAGASRDAAVVEAAYETLTFYIPSSAGPVGTARTASLAAIPDGQAKTDGIAVGHQAASNIIALRTGDGRQTPIGSTSSFPTKTPGPGVWRLTPPAYLAPQTPWAGTMKPFVLPHADRFLPPPPPSLSSAKYVAGVNEIKVMGQNTSTQRTAAETATAWFWTANAIRQDNRLVRDITDARSLGLLDTARLAAMINVTDADAGIAVLNAKYHYLFWRPVTAIDPTSVTADGFGPVPGFSDNNAGTVEEVGWRPLVVTPNHPEYPAATARSRRPSTRCSPSSSGPTRSTSTSTGSMPAGPRATSMRSTTSPRRKTFAGRSSAPASGPACTTASRARPASTSVGAWRSTTSSTPSSPCADRRQPRRHEGPPRGGPFIRVVDEARRSPACAVAVNSRSSHSGTRAQSR